MNAPKSMANDQCMLLDPEGRQGIGLLKRHKAEKAMMEMLETEGPPQTGP